MSKSKACIQETAVPVVSQLIDRLILKTDLFELVRWLTSPEVCVALTHDVENWDKKILEWWEFPSFGRRLKEHRLDHAFMILECLCFVVDLYDKDAEDQSFNWTPAEFIKLLQMVVPAYRLDLHSEYTAILKLLEDPKTWTPRNAPIFRMFVASAKAICLQ